MNGPIFVFGIGRTGTTLLARMLDLHTDVSIYLESRFLDGVDAANADGVLNEAAAARMVDRLSDPAAQGVARDAVLRRFVATDRTVRALFDTILRVRMEAHGKRRYGEKTPSHFTKAEILRAWYPDARFVWLHRDPRDAYASFKHSRDHAGLPWADRTLVGRCLYWNHYRRALAEAKRHWPDQVHEVELTALVRDPAATLAAVCAFVGVPFDARMLAVAGNNSSFADTRDAAGVRPEVLDRRSRLGRGEAAIIELLCGAHMLAHGLPLSAAARRAIALLSALGWYPLAERVHHAIRRRRAAHS